MSPESDPNPAVPDMAAESFHLSFQRGKLLVLAAMIAIFLVAVEDTVRHTFSSEISDSPSGRLIGLALVGWLGWRCFHGGPLAKGCLAILCFPMIMATPFLMLLLISKILDPFGHGSASVNDFHDIGANWRSTLLFLPAFGASVFTVWALVISKDAGLYLRVRRSGLSEAEALPFEWERDHWRQEPSDDAP